MKTKHLALALTGFALLTQACGSTATTATGTADQITATIQSPNGDPVAGATVWIPSSTSVSASKLIKGSKNIITGTGGITCDDTPEAASDSDCSSATGAVTLSCTGTGSTTVKYAKGSFSGSTTIACGATATTTSFLASSASSIAVVTGSYDRMEDVLAKLGFGTVDSSGRLTLGTETFDLFDGHSSLDSTYQDFDKLLDGTVDLDTYDIIFINCGTDAFESYLSDATVVSRLRNYVNDGGKLYVTDQSYDWVEQVFPEHIDFDNGGDNLGAVAETDDAAQAGSSSFYDENATVENALMISWLDAVTVNTGTVEDSGCASATVNGTTGALNSDDSIFIGDFLPSWAQMDDFESGATVTTWITGTDVQTDTDRPLTVSFDHGSGKVLYSSYHTAESCSTTGFWPQERVLQYLVFEL